MERRIKLFNIIALASAILLALLSLTYNFIGWERNWEILNSISLLAWMGFFVAYIILLVSNFYRRISIFGTIGCGLIVITTLNLSGVKWISWIVGVLGVIGMILIAVSIIHLPKTHVVARVVGFIGLGYNSIIRIVWLVFSIVTTCSETFPKQFYNVIIKFSSWPGAVADVLFVVPFIAMLLARSEAIIEYEFTPNRETENWEGTNMERQIKLFNIIALASAILLALLPLTFNFIGWERNWEIQHSISLLAWIGFFVAYIILLVSNFYRRISIFGTIWCGLIVITTLNLSGVKWISWIVGVLGVIGMILIAVSIIHLPNTHVVARVAGLIGLGYSSIIKLAWLVLSIVTTCSGTFPEQFYNIIVEFSSWPRAVADMLLAIPFIAMLFTSIVNPHTVNPHKFTLIEVFAYSVFLCGFIVFIFNLACGSPNADSCAWNNEKSWDSEFVASAIYTLIANTLLGFFILSQIKVKDCLELLKTKGNWSGPACLVIVRIMLYIALIACVIGFVWMLVADDYAFRYALEQGFINNTSAYMRLGMFRHLSRIKEIINLRTYFTIVMFLSAWYCLGLAKLMSLLGSNSAIAYSLRGKGERRISIK